MASTSKLIFLVPSGDTSWQDQDRVQGNTDLPLSEAGDRQVRAMAAAWAPRMAGAKTLFTSPDEASRQTAAVLAEQMGAKVKPVDDLVEMDLGLWQGLTESELKERYRSTFHHWQDDPATVSVPQGEQLDAVLERLESTVVKLIGKTGSDPLVLVLRPVLFDLAERWLSPARAAAAAANESGAAGAAPAAEAPIHKPTPTGASGRDAERTVRQITLDEPTWRTPRVLRHTKRISA